MFDKRPILVEVVGDQYFCYGPPTRRSRRLMAILKAAGGISETVPDGHYNFNVHKRIATLTPVK